MRREDDFQTRRTHLDKMTDTELEQYFWSLTDKLVAPLLELGRKNTSPAIERSVLLRMGFSSLEAKPIVDMCIEKSLLSHGAGNVVYRLAKAKGMDIRQAGLALCEGRLWDEAENLFKEARA